MQVAPEPNWWKPANSTSAAAGERPGETTAYWALIGFVAVLLIAPQHYLPFLRPLHLAALFGAISIGASIGARVWSGIPLSGGHSEVWLTGVLVAWALITVPLSMWPGGSLSTVTGTFLKSVVIFWVLSVVVNTQVRLRRLALLLVLASIPLSITAITNYIDGLFVAGVPHHELSRIVGYEAPLTTNPNDLAMMLNLILPLTIAFLMMSKRGWMRTLLAVAVVLTVVAIIATFSRAAFLTLAAVALIHVWRLGRRSAALAMAALGLLLFVAVMFLPSNFAGHLGTITDIESDPTGSAQARWGDSKEAVGIILDNPLTGVGAGQNVLALNEARGSTWREVHNVFLEYGADLGLFGLAIFSIILWSVIRKARRVERAATRAGNTELSRLAEGINISLVAFAIQGFFLPVAYNFYFYLLAGMALALSTIWAEQAGRSTATTRSPSQRQAATWRPTVS